MVRYQMRRGIAAMTVVAALAAGPRTADLSPVLAVAHLPAAIPAVTCPAALDPGSDALPRVMTTTRRYLVVFGKQNNHVHYIVDGLESLANTTWPYYGFPVYRANAVRACGATIVDRSWIAFVHSPQLEKCCSWWQARLYLARTRSGWRVWRVCNNSSC
jgi:hypothetical protein